MATLPCPQCREPLEIPRPPPAQIQCAKCGATIKVSPNRKPDAPTHQPATAPPRAGSKTGALIAISVVVLLVAALGELSYVAFSGSKHDGEPQIAKDDKDDPEEEADLNYIVPEAVFARFKKQEQQPNPINPQTKKAVDKGVAYLRTLSPHAKPNAANRRVGELALMGLALLECGVAADDADVKALAAVVRSSGPKLGTTYDAATAILFLDRLNKDKAAKGDVPLIRSLGLRLVAGQNRKGGLWSYNIPLLDAKGEEALLKELQGNKYEPHGVAGPDLSNSQFAALGLWVARRYEVPVDPALKAAAATIRTTQNGKTGTWGYHVSAGAFHDSATCVGLIMLALGRGVADEKDKSDLLKDPVASRGIAHLGVVVGKDVVAAPPGLKPAVLKRRPANRLSDAHGDLYFLWALERTALILNLKTIGDRDWHEWGSAFVLARQNPDGSWKDMHQGAADTCFALLFLMRGNLFQDLTNKLDLAGPGEQIGGNSAPATPPDGNPRQRP